MSNPQNIQKIVQQHLSKTEGKVDYIEVRLKKLTVKHCIQVTSCSFDNCFIQVVEASTLEPVADIQGQPTILAVAILFGSVRLIDNIMLCKEPG